MERTISQEERIKRAEEIYLRRRTNNVNGVRVSGSSVNTNKTKLSLFKKMWLQLAICAVIYIIFYLVKNTNYIFSEDVISKTKEMLSYDINFGNVYSQVSSFIENNKDKFVIPPEVSNEQGDEKENLETNTEAEQVGENVVETNITQEGGIGGAETNETNDTSSNENTKKSQMEIDAEYIKKNYSFKLPLKGTVTSRYGEREATEIVSANHQGIDIGANTGTAIYAAMEGTATLVSSEGEYRKTYRNNKWRSYDKICSL